METETRITRGERREEKRACKRRDRNYRLAAERESRRQVEQSRRKARKEKEVWNC
jgi:hypothetical protein